MTPDDGERALMRVLRDCRANGVLGRVGAVLEATLREELPRDAHERCSRGNLHVSITTPKLLGPWNAGTPDENRVGFNGGPVALDGELVSAFDTFDDLVGALLSSCHIPLYCGWPTRAYRGKRRVDGGWDESRADAAGESQRDESRVVPAVGRVERDRGGRRRGDGELLREGGVVLGGVGRRRVERVAHRAGRRGGGSPTWITSP